MDQTHSTNFANPTPKTPEASSSKSRVGLSLALAGVAVVVGAITLGIFLTKATPMRHVKILAVVTPLAVGGAVVAVASSLLLRKKTPETHQAPTVQPERSEPVGTTEDPIEQFAAQLGKRLDSVQSLSTIESFKDGLHQIYEEDLKKFSNTPSIHQGLQTKLQGQCEQNVKRLPSSKECNSVRGASEAEKSRLEKVPQLVIKDCFEGTPHRTELYVGNTHLGDPFFKTDGSRRSVDKSLDLLEEAIGEQNQEWLPYLELQFTQMAQGMGGAVGTLNLWAMQASPQDQDLFYDVKIQPVHMDVKIVKDSQGQIQEIQLEQTTPFSYQHGNKDVGGGLKLNENYVICKDSEGKLSIQNYRCQIDEMPDNWKP